MSTFQCLYFLQGQSIYLIEIKRLDIADDSEISDVFKWFRVEKETMHTTVLHFSAMDSTDQIEERYFKEGFLKFNEHSGTYIEKFNSAQHSLLVIKDKHLSTELQNSILEQLNDPILL